MKQRIYLVSAVLVAVVAIGWNIAGVIQRSYTERIVLKLQDGMEFGLTYPSGSYSMAVVETDPYHLSMYSRALKVDGLWCRIEQGSRVCYEGYVNGITRFKADGERHLPVIIRVKIRENADLFSRCHLVLGQPA